MIQKHSMCLTGSSGENYNFIVFGMDRDYEKEGAVYIVTICTEQEEGSFSFNHGPVFLGQTDNLNGHFDNHPKARCFTLAAEAMKASSDNIAIGSIIENDPERRREIYQDLEGQFKWVCNSWTP